MDVGGLPAAFWWVWAGTLVNRTGAFVLPFLSYYLTQDQGHSAAFAGFVAALNAVGAAVSAVAGGVLADRIGRRPTLLGANVGAAAMLIALGLVHSVPLIAVFSFLVGLTNNASRPATSAMIADLVPPRDRTRAYALNFWGANVGFSIAMLAAGVAASHGYLLLFIGDAATTLACAVLIFWALSASGSAAVWWASLALGLVSVPGWLALDRPVAARAAANRLREAGSAPAGGAVPGVTEPAEPAGPVCAASAVAPAVA